MFVVRGLRVEHLSITGQQCCEGVLPRSAIPEARFDDQTVSARSRASVDALVVSM
jgi:hypothetical protein